MKRPRVSRQRKWQLANLAVGLCKLCPEMREGADPTYCRAHREAKRESDRERMRRRRGTTVVT